MHDKNTKWPESIQKPNTKKKEKDPPHTLYKRKVTQHEPYAFSLGMKGEITSKCS